MLLVRANEHKAAGAARPGASRALRERAAPTGLLRSCFVRTQTWLQAGKYLNALASDLPSRNGRSIAQYPADRSPGKSQRLLNRASWDERAAMSLARRYAAAGLDDAARRSRRRQMTAGLASDFICGDEVYGSCTDLREYLEGHGQAYVLRVASNFMLTLAGATKMTCAEAVNKPLNAKKAREVRSAGQGPKGERWYARAWLATASRHHSLLVRRHPKSGELAPPAVLTPGGNGRFRHRCGVVRAAGGWRAGCRSRAYGLGLAGYRD
jgi:hypothetical protein